MTRRFLVPLSADHVDYNLASTSENGEGRLRWDSDFGTLSIGIEGGDVELPIGQKHGAFVKNESGVNIGKGKAVQFAGAKGGKITVAKAVADGAVDPKFMFGITAEAIDDDDFGFVVTDGYIRGLNTSGIEVGTLLYFDPDTPGELTTTKPTAPAINIPVAVVTFSNAAAGVVFVRMQQEFPLDEIQDILISDLSNGDTLVYNSASAIWTNAPQTGGGVTSLTGTTNQINVSASTGAVTLSLPSTVSTDLIKANEFIISTNNLGDGPSLSSPEENINLWYYDGVDFSVAGQETNPTGLFFKPDGTRFYITGTTSDRIIEYSMSTPWDISTASFVQQSVTVGEATPQELFFRSDGAKAYITGTTGDTVREFDLTTPWDVSTLTFLQQISVQSEENAPTGLAFKSDGTKMYIVGTQNDRVSEWNLSTPWDVSTATLFQSFSVQDLEPNPGSVDFNSAGTKMWISGTTGDYIYEFDLGTAWDVSTATYFGRTYVGFQELTPAAVWVQLSQGKAWVLGQTADRVFEYKTNGTGLYLNSNINYIEGQTEFDDPVFFASPLASRSTIRIEGAATFAGNSSVAGTFTASGGVTMSTTTGAINIASSQTTGATIIGGTNQTGAITIGRSTNVQAINIANGAITSGRTKTVNIGTESASGSTTEINIGSNVSGATNNIKLEGNVDFTSASVIGIELLPSQTGNSGKYLTTNGTVASWGAIDLSSKADINSPTFTGVPAAPTAAADTNTTQLATTAFVVGQASSASPVALGTVAVGTSLRYARADHVHPTTGLGLTSGTLAQFAATTSAQLAGVISDETGTGALVFATSPTLTTPNIGVATGTSFNSITGLSSTNPTMNGTVAVGTGTTVARADHVHPSDTSRAALASPTFTGVPAAPTAAVDTNTTQLATTAFVIGQASSVNPSALGAVAVGNSLRYARANHVHPTTGLALLSGATFTGSIIAPAATTSITSIRIPHGTAPTSPTNGDIWTTTVGLFGRIDSVTQEFATKQYVDANSSGEFDKTMFLGGM